MSAGFSMPETIEIDAFIAAHTGLCIAANDACLSVVEYIRRDVAQAQLDKMRVARGLQHDAKWHELYRAINVVVMIVARDKQISPQSHEYFALSSALIAIDNGVYIEPEKWSVL